MQAGKNRLTVSIPSKEESSHFALLEAAELGNADAQYKLAQYFYMAEGVGNLVQALKWYKIAADNKHANSLYDMGVFFRDGKHFHQDEACAFTYFRDAALLGNAQAMVELCLCYRYGNGVKKDIGQAAFWSERVAMTREPESVPAKIRLATYYFDGLYNGKPFDKIRKRAAVIFLFAAKLNSQMVLNYLSQDTKYVELLRNIGNAYIKGNEAIEVNLDEAHKFLSQADQKGSKAARLSLIEVNAQLQSIEVVAAKRKQLKSKSSSTDSEAGSDASASVRSSVSVESVPKEKESGLLDCFRCGV